MKQAIRVLPKIFRQCQYCLITNIACNIFFLIFINDLCDTLLGFDIKYMLFADDLTVYASRRGDGLCDDLVIALCTIEDWCLSWQLNLALDKCLVIRLGSRASLPSSVCTYKLYNQPIKVSCSTKDLGVVVDDRLKFSEHISSTVHKALTRCRLIFKCFSSRNRDLLVKAYVTYVRLLLEYCSSVWSPHHRCLIDKIEKVSS